MTTDKNENLVVNKDHQDEHYNKAYNKSLVNKLGRKKKFCKLCMKGIERIDYKNVELLNKYLNQNLKIIARRVSGICQKHQRRIANAIKKARIVALIPFIKR